MSEDTHCSDIFFNKRGFRKFTHEIIVYLTYDISLYEIGRIPSTII